MSTPGKAKGVLFGRGEPCLPSALIRGPIRLTPAQCQQLMVALTPRRPLHVLLQVLSPSPSRGSRESGLKSLKP